MQISDFDDFNADGDALGIDGSFALHEDFHAFASYAAADLNFGVDATTFDIGVGYNTELSNVVDAYARLSYEYVDLNDSGDETALVLGGLYNFTPAFAVGLFGEWGDDVSAYTLLGRFC